MATQAVQTILDGFPIEKVEEILHSFAAVVRGFDRNQPKCSPANRRRHLTTLFSLLICAGGGGVPPSEDDVLYIVDQITQMLAYLPLVTNPGYVLTRSAEVLTSDPSDDETPHVENASQKVLLRRLRCIFTRLGVCSYWIGPGITRPGGGDTSMNHFLFRGIQRRMRDLLILQLKGDRLPADEVPRLDYTDVAALLSVRIPDAVVEDGSELVEDDEDGSEPVEDGSEPVEDGSEPVEDDEYDDKTVQFGTVDPALKHNAQAAFVPVQGQFKQPTSVVYVPVSGQMMIAHMSEEIENLNAHIAQLMKVNSDQSTMLDHLMHSHGYPVSGVQKAYAPFPTWG